MKIIGTVTAITIALLGVSFESASAPESVQVASVSGSIGSLATA